MNLALSALIILLLLLPAFSFRIGVSLNLYVRKRREVDSQHLQDQIIAKNVSKALSKLNFTETVFLFSFVPLVLHMISLIVIEKSGDRIHYDILLNIFSGKDNIVSESGNSAFNDLLMSFLGYSLVETSIGLLLGVVVSRLLADKKWVLRGLTGNSNWYQMFMGGLLTEKQKKEVDFVVVQVLTQTKEGSIIYMGYLRSFELTADNQISQLTLSSAKRMDLRFEQITRNSGGPMVETRMNYSEVYGPLIEIPGDGFTVVGKEIQNVNVQYMKKWLDPDVNLEILVPVLQ